MRFLKVLNTLLLLSCWIVRDFGGRGVKNQGVQLEDKVL